MDRRNQNDETTAKSSFLRSSFCNSASCVWIAKDGDRVLVSDQQKGGTVLTFTKEEWSVFLQGAQNGEFDIDHRGTSSN